MLLLIPALLLLINLWVFMPFFNLGLFGDDWLAIFRYSYYLDAPQHLGLYSTEYFNNFKYLLNAYGSQDTLMAFLYKYFGSESNIYFLLSYTLRVIVALSVYFPAYLLTKQKLTSWFAVFFFLFSSVGLSASSWVFNMPSYLAITFFSFLLYFYLKYSQDNKLNNLLLTYLFFALTFLSTPIRAHGLIPFIIFLEIIMAFFKQKWEFRKIALRISGLFAIYLVIYLLGFKETISGSPTSSLIIGLRYKLQLISQGQIDFLLYPVATLGNILIPDFLLSPGWRIESLGQYLFKIASPFFLVYLSVLFILKKNIGNLDPKFFRISTLIGTIWSVLVFIFFKLNPETLSLTNNASSLLIGGYFLILVFNLFIYLKTDNLIKGGLLITLGWTIISYLYPWWQTNTSAIFPTTHRYLIISGVGLTLLLAVIVSLGKNPKSIRFLLVITILLLIGHAIYTKNSLRQEYQTHNRQIVNKIWSQMPFISEVGKSAEPMIFYFQGDGTNETILRDSVTFGFPPHMAILYKIPDEEKIPQPMSDWKQVISAVSDGKSIGKDKSVSIERIYAFQLLGKDNLVNITEPARQKLKELLSSP